MTYFHQNLVDQIPRGHLSDLKNQCFVFPTKRGGVFFKRALLAQYSEHNFMLPAILSIEEFVEKLTGMTISDELTLLFHLFKIYQKKDKDLAFDDFYAWGKIILKDYDEIDRYLADAPKIYSSLQNIKEIDHVFGYNDEFREIIARYRTLTDKQEKTKLLTKFLKIWEEVGAVYETYQEELAQEEKAYGGMLYRNLANILSQENFDHPFKQYHFCGFNALSKAEEVIFDALVKAEIAQIYWDVDQYYLDNKIEEAGDFLREYLIKWPQSIAFNANSEKLEKQVRIHSVPQNMAQAELAAQMVNELIKKGAQPEETAVVLADEKLLIPLLYCMPMTEHKVNVTMGYPMRSTVVYDFANTYLELIRKARVIDGQVLFHTYDLKPFFSNAYASVFQEGIFQNLQQWILTENKTRISREELIIRVKSEELKSLFDLDIAWPSIYEALKGYLTKVFYSFKEQEEHETEREFIYFFLKSMNQLNDYLADKNEFSLKLIKKVIQEHFRSVKIPFEGEPVQGIQVMGFLETRTLDFKHIIVVSANEGKLPTARSLNSYIPFGLRKVFELPTFEEQDAIYAYHFKRLIQRAEDVHFIYDNTTQGDSTGEKSRFILQELKRFKTSDQVQVQELQYDGVLPELEDTRAIEIVKSAKVLKQLERFTNQSEEGKFLSPTSLTNYVTCPLKFYLKNVVSFRELDDVEEDIDARNLGIVVHEVLELLYKPWLGREVTSDQIKLLKGQVEKQLIESLHRNKIIQPNQQLSGRDLVTKEVMEQLIQKVLDLDKADAPIKVVGLEQTGYEELVKVGNRTAKISGTIDRLDEKDGVLRVIDYKTGKVKFVSNNRGKRSLDEMLEMYFSDPEYKSGFQAYLYAALIAPHFDQPIKVGITTMKELNQGTQWLKGNYNLEIQEIEAFSSKLHLMVKEIFDPQVPFEQTDDLDRCAYCEFKKVCKRM